jgi:hypothetical protein
LIRRAAEHRATRLQKQQSVRLLDGRSRGEGGEPDRDHRWIVMRLD